MGQGERWGVQVVRAVRGAESGAGIGVGGASG